jgi:hypothetical protein
MEVTEVKENIMTVTVTEEKFIILFLWKGHF